MIKVGVAGVGNFGRHHVRIYNELPNCELIGVYDSDADRAQTIASTFATTAFASLDALLSNIDAISIVTPTIDHVVTSVESLDKGIHVLVEKPIADTLENADRIITASGGSGAALTVGHLERFNPAFRSAADGFNNLRFFRSERLGPWVGTNLDVDVVTDLMIHDLDILNILANSTIVDVRATGMAVLSDQIDIVNARLTYESGAAAMLDCSRVSARKHRTVRIYSDTDYRSIDFINNTAIRAVPIDDHNGPSIKKDQLAIKESEPLKEEIKAFIEFIGGEKSAIASGEQARQALQMVELVKSATGFYR